MANNLAVQILINARDQASGVINKIKSSWLALGAAIGGTALFGSAINEAADFEQAMANVGAVSGATEADLAALTAQARELGSTTSFSASEAAEGMKYLAMAGFDVQQTMDAMPGLLNLAAAGAVDLGTAADVASNILSGLGLEAAEMGRVADVMAATFTSSNTTLESLGETMKYVAPIAAQAGVSLEEAAAMAGKLGDAGIQGSEAGTALRAALIRLAAPPAEAAKALDQLGVATRDSVGNIRPVTDILAELEVELNKLGSGDKIGAASKIFGVEAASAGLVLTAQAASGELAAMTEAIGRQGTAAEIAEKQNATFHGAMKTLGSALSELRIAFGTRFLDPFVEQIRGAASAIVDFSASPAFAKIGQAFLDAFETAATYIRQFMAEFDWDSFVNGVANATQRAAEAIRSLGETLEAGRKTALTFIAGWQVLVTGFHTIEAAFFGLAGVVAQVMAKLISLSATGARGILGALGPIGQAILMLTGAMQELAGVDLDALAESLQTSADESFRRAGEAIDKAADSGRNFQATLDKINTSTQNTSGLDRVAAAAHRAADDTASATQRIDEALSKTYDPTKTAEAQALARASQAYAEALRTVGQQGGATAAQVEQLKQAMDDAGQAYQARITEMDTYRDKARAIQVAAFQLSIAERDYQAALKQSQAGNVEAGMSLAKLGEQLKKAKDEHDRLNLALKREMGLPLSTEELERFIALTGDATAAQQDLNATLQQASSNDGSTVPLEQAKAMFREIGRLQDAYESLRAAGDDIGAAKVMEQLQALQREYAATDQSAGDSVSQIIQDVGQLESEYSRLRGQAESIWASGGSIRDMADAFDETRTRARALAEELKQVDTSGFTDAEQVQHLRAMQTLFTITRDDAQSYAGALSAAEQAGQSLTNTVSADAMKGLLSRDAIAGAASEVDRLKQAYADGAISLDELKQKGGEALDRITALSSGADQPIVPEADTSDIEAKITDVETRLEALRAQPASIEITTEISQAEAELERLQAELKAAETSATVRVDADTESASLKITEVARPTESTHTVDPDTAAAEAAIKALQKDTSSTHTVYVREVTTSNTGGPILRRTTGGAVFQPLAGDVVPGIGNQDTHPARLPVGSFVLRKKAAQFYGANVRKLASGGWVDALLTPGERVIPPRIVAKHGLGFFEALNNMRIPKFATGGAVSTSASTSAPARDSVDINLSLGGQRVQLQGARDQANALAGALRSLSRGA